MDNVICINRSPLNSQSITGRLAQKLRVLAGLIEHRTDIERDELALVLEVLGEQLRSKS